MLGVDKMVLKPKHIAIILILVLIISLLQGCSFKTNSNVSENTQSNDKQTNDSKEQKNNSPQSSSSSNNEQNNDLNNEESMAFEGPLTNNFKDEVNIQVLNCNGGRSGGYEKISSKDWQWQESLSPLLEKIFKNVDLNSLEFIHSEDKFLKDLIFNMWFPKDKELSELDLKSRYIRVKYKDKVILPIKDKEIQTDDFAVFYNEEKNILELYIHKDNGYEKYEVKDKDLVNEFIKWYDERRNYIREKGMG